jgi:hypothetical protein
MWFLLGLLTCRFLVITLPIFESVRENNLFLNLLTGLASDLFFVAIFYVIFECLQVALGVAKSRSVNVGGAFLAVIFLLIINAGLIAHLRYVEHFGMTVRSHHVATLKTGGLQSAGFGIIFESWRTVMIVFLPVALAGFSALKLSFPSPRFSRKMGATLGLAIIFNTANIALKNRAGVHRELRFNPYAALYYNDQDYKNIAEQPVLAQNLSTCFD